MGMVKARTWARAPHMPLIPVTTSRLSDSSEKKSLHLIANKTDCFCLRGKLNCQTGIVPVTWAVLPIDTQELSLIQAVGSTMSRGFK